MATVKVQAPVRDYAGPGPGGAVFADGAAQVEAKEIGALDYYRRAGYTVGGKVYHREPDEVVTAPAPGTPTNPDGIVRQPWSNDAAVMADAGGPDSDAFLPPTNAGDADPHGPLVVAPGIHGVGPKPIRGGEVFVDNPEKQEKAETALAEAVLVEGKPATVNTKPKASKK